jgi:thiamine-monophosphate kinase
MANRKKSHSGELALIERVRALTRQLPSSHHLRLGIGDDCAILRAPAGHELLLTTDFSLEGRHFRRAWHSPQSIAHRTLARGLSDIAAMGGKPLAAFLSIALPKAVARDKPWLDGFLEGLLALASETGVSLAGGDTAESPGSEVLADIVLLGSAPTGRALTRSGAHPGDSIYCTGALGGAAAELAQLSKSPSRFRRATSQEDHPHLFPQPRLAVGMALLRRRLATACIDISDGLSTDLQHLCQASGVAAELDAALLPAHPLTASFAPAEQIAAILHGGEDYELLFTTRPTAKVPRSLAGVPITRIGRVLPYKKSRPSMTILAEGTRFELQPQGWEHLR